jgi:predicted CXXCH cytochrome family protein
VTAPYEKNLQEFTAQVSGPCGACHIPHNASGKRLWAKPLLAQENFATQICAGCHNSNGVAKAKLIGDNSHPIDVSLEKTKLRQPREQAARELPLYSKDGDRMPDGKILCITCHEPHTWDSRKPGPLENYAPLNMEGDAANSFLRKANLPSPELCNICHVNESRIEDTVHDRSETSPEAKNLLGQTVKTSGSCGVCHLVHNAPHALKLWARPYGPITEKANRMDGLCTSCHSKGNIAEKKIPPVVSHPAGKLVTNIMPINDEGTTYMPIFDLDGEEKNVGDISCPTCHNAHEWGPPVDEMATGKKAKGNPVKSFRFLRNMSYNTFCINCHGAEAIYRYMYFHVPEKRTKR